MTGFMHEADHTYPLSVDLVVSSAGLLFIITYTSVIILHWTWVLNFTAFRWIGLFPPEFVYTCFILFFVWWAISSLFRDLLICFLVKLSMSLFSLML